MPAIGDLLRLGGTQLQAAGVEQPRLDARLLLTEALGCGVEELIANSDAPVDAACEARYAQMIVRRRAREPVSRILGRREFWSMEFAVSSDTLDPRPDSETLVSAALDLVADRNRALRILDIGTGSGCLLLALLSELPRAQGVGIDVSPGALNTARANASRHELSGRAHFIACDLRLPGWASSTGGSFDVVIANPPYIPAAAIAGLAREVSGYDPHAALSGGEDGLDFYRIITTSLIKLLVPGGFVVLEAGDGQAEAIEAMLCKAGLSDLAKRQDLGGVSRAITGRTRAESVIKD